MDLKSLSLTTMDLPHIGTVKTRPNTLGVHRALSEMKDFDVISATDFVRNILKVVIIEPDDGEFATTLTNLDASQIDDIAERFGEVCIARDLFQTKPDTWPGVSASQSLKELYSAEFGIWDESVRKTAQTVHTKLLAPMMKTELERAQLMISTSNLQAALSSLILPKYDFPKLTLPESTLSLLTALQNEPPAFEQLRKIVADMQGIAAPLAAASLAISAQYSDLERMTQAIADQYRPFERIFANSSIAPLAFETGQLAAFLRRPGFNAAAIVGLERLASRATISELLFAYDDLNKPDTGDDLRGALDAVHILDTEDAEDLASQAAIAYAARFSDTSSSRRPLLSIEISADWVTAVISAAALWYASQSPNHEDIARLETEIRGIRTILEQERADRADESASIRRLTTRYNLRAAQNTDADIIAVIQPDQLIRVLELDGKWARVEVIPYAGGNALEGWMHRGALRPLSH